MGHAKDQSGVWGHSSAIGADSFIVFAVGDDLIRQKAFLGWAAYQNIGLKPLLGCYTHDDGHTVTENSFIVNSRHLGALLNAGWLKGQESILWLGKCDSRDRREAELRYLTAAGDDIRPHARKLGVLQSVDRDTALSSSAWSYDPATGEYFICIDPGAIKLCPHGLQAANDLAWDICRDLSDSSTLQNLIKAYVKAARTI